MFDEKIVDFWTRFAGPEGRLLRLPGAPIYVGMQNYVSMLRNWNVLPCKLNLDFCFLAGVVSCVCFYFWILPMCRHFVEYVVLN